MPLPSSRAVCVLFCSLSLLLVGCGSSSMVRIPPPPTFTTMPATAAVEGQLYTYQIAATTSDGSSITFSLMAGPSGAALSGNTISWTPTHAESRTSNAFTVVATTSAGGSAPQSWTVTPNGNVNITAVNTFWTPSGPVNVTRQFLANQLPAALIPQADGSFATLQGVVNADGSISVPNVPAGTYLLRLGLASNFFTSTSDFDAGADIVGGPGGTTSQSTTTTFNYSISGISPPQTSADFLSVRTDDANIPSMPVRDFILPGTSSLNFSVPTTLRIDWSKISTLFVSQYQRTTAGNFTGYLLGPSQTLSNVAFTNGATNAVNATLSQGQAASLSLQITGSAWAALASPVGPGSPSAAFSDFSAFAQPFVTDRLATAETSTIGPDLPLIRPTSPLSNTLSGPTIYACTSSVGPFSSSLTPFLGIAPITTDTDFGTLSYNDPFPAAWPRLFQYCQASTFSLPRPNSSLTDTFIVTNKQTTGFPTAAVTPILSNVQSPMLNGSSFFTATTLNTTTLNLSWTAPASGTPFGYFVEVFQLSTFANGSTGYLGAGIYATSLTSMTIPFISANATYVFALVAISDANATVETHPFRHQIPSAESAIVSAPIVIAPGATATIAPAP